jgi:hypothetical protein
MEFLDIVKDSNLINEKQFGELKTINDEIIKAYKTMQRFRTRTEMEASVLNDVTFPTPDAKYWQSVREQSGMFNALVNLSFDYRRNNIYIKQKENELADVLDPLEKELLAIDLEELQMKKLEMEREAFHRIREVTEWQEIKDELKPLMRCSDTDVNEHQLVSYTQRWVMETVIANQNGSKMDNKNLVAQLDKGLKMCVQKGCLDKVLEPFDENIQHVITSQFLPELTS